MPAPHEQSTARWVLASSLTCTLVVAAVFYFGVGAIECMCPESYACGGDTSCCRCDGDVFACSWRCPLNATASVCHERGVAPFVC
jgi:hypothetical protein